MFFKVVKDILLKRKLKSRISDVASDIGACPINTVGIVVDESSFADTEMLVGQLESNGIQRENISLLAYRDHVGKSAENAYKLFDLDSFDWKGAIINPVVSAFVEKKYDLLINYYDFERTALMYVSDETEAHFKVGFPSLDKRLNHLTISTVMENYQIFTSELFKYLKILNKV